MAQRVLIVDDEAAIRTSLSEALAEVGIEVATACDGADALARVKDFSPGLVLSDVRMPNIGGLELLHALRERMPAVDVVLMTAYDDMATVASAMRGGAVDFLVKPVGLAPLLALVSRVFEDRQLRSRATRAKDGAAADDNVTLVGRDSRMIEIYKRVGQAAASNATVLIRGESGTGKELIARAIHTHSDAAAEPFIPVNCAALPSTLLESELFGHVRGAFTGAHEARRGRFALARRGTIFLDEIGDTSLEFQTKLLRVIQDHEFQPVGADRIEVTEARVISATHQNLEGMIEDRRFREDLYYRLRVLEITIPPLRERVQDIPLLAAHMLRRAGSAILSEAALGQLMTYKWPGNVRELENCLRRAVVIASGNVIHPEHLSLGQERPAPGSRMSSLEEVEREQVARVLAATKNHKGKAADILGVSRPRLRRLMEKYGLE